MTPSAPTTLRRPLLAALCLAGLLTSVSAGVFTPIDPHKQADVTGQTVDLPTLQFDSVAQPYRTLPGATVTGQTVDRSHTVATKNVELNTLDFARVPTKTVPLTNFTTKRAPLDQPPIETGTTPTDSAKINSRTIRPLTPTGHQELKDQINKIP